MARLPVYHRALLTLEQRGEKTVSSADLSVVTGVTAPTVRRDLSHLGSFGTRGTGYAVSQLLARVDRALGIDREWPVVVVGIGSLGRALARSGNFSARGLKVVALLDIDPQVVGSAVGGVAVEHVDRLEAVVKREEAAIAVLATPPGAAQSLADRLAAAGVRAILNLAPVVLRPALGVRVGTVDLAAELQVLAFYGARTEGLARTVTGAGRRRRQSS